MKIKIGLHAKDIIKTLPELDIKVGRKLLQTVVLENHDPVILEFNENFAKKKYTLNITLKNKTNDDTVINDAGDMEKSMSVTIDFIEFEDIDISSMLFTHSSYYPKYPEPWYSQQETKPDKFLKNCLDMGWNGTFKLKFRSPIFEWFLENL